MSRRSGRAEMGRAACVLAVLALLLVLAPDASASSPPSWQVISSHVPAEIPLAEAPDQQDTVTIASSAAGEAPYVGHFLLELENEAGELGETKPLRYAASAAAVQASLEAVEIIGRGNVKVTGGPNTSTGKGQKSWTYTVTFTGALRGSEVTMEEEEVDATPAEEAAVEREGGEPEEGGAEVTTVKRGQHDTITYQLAALNTGGSPSSGRITLTDTLPPGLTTEATPSGSGWACTPAGWGQSTVTCVTDAVVQPGASSSPITLSAYVDITHGVVGEQLVNTAAISGGGASSGARAGEAALVVQPTAANTEPAHPHPLATGSHQIQALLARVLVPTGRGLSIPAVLKADGTRIAFRAPQAGVAVIDWYENPAGHAHKPKPKPVLVATGQLSFQAGERAKIKVILTRAGKTLLKHSKKLKLTSTATFTPAGQAPIRATRTLLLAR
jgi:uncharacterized repeat protein (TIGR01451 family)